MNKFYPLFIVCALGSPLSLMTCNSRNQNANNSVTTVSNRSNVSSVPTNLISSPSPSPTAASSVDNTSNSNTNSVSNVKSLNNTAPKELSIEEMEYYKEPIERCKHTPVPEVTAKPTTGVAPLTVTFDGSKSFDPDKGKIVGWKWYFEDGTTREGRIVNYTFNKSGTYGVSISVLDSQGQSSSDCSGGILAATITVAESKGSKQKENQTISKTLQP